SKYGDKNGLTVDEARDIVVPAIMAKRGTLDWYSVDYWSKRFDLDVLKLNHDLAHLIQPRPLSIEFLDWLLSEKKTVWLTTNAWPATIDIKLNRVDLSAFLDRIVSSHDLGAAKEDQAFWHALFDLHSVAPERCLFIDDSESVLEAAQAFGIQHLYCIEQPDLSKPARGVTQFESLSAFSQIAPSLSMSDAVG
ncbi:MAG: HAD-IA family hydrolase, partial [Pseudomonadota bacterium]